MSAPTTERLARVAFPVKRYQPLTVVAQGFRFSDPDGSVHTDWLVGIVATERSEALAATSTLDDVTHFHVALAGMSPGQVESLMEALTEARNYVAAMEAEHCTELERLEHVPR